MSSSLSKKIITYDAIERYHNNLEEYLSTIEVDLAMDITWANLVDLRNYWELTPGKKYRIIDYMTTTSQSGTISAGHPFDVIVTALDEHTLSENASAVRSVRDTDNYFGTENVEAWQLKYCLDNDTERFAWADNSTNSPSGWKTEIIANYTVDPDNNQSPYNLDSDSKIYEFSTRPHPETGVITPVFFAQDPDFYEEMGCDYSDIYFYNGVTTVDGITYDSWAKYSAESGSWVNIDGGLLCCITARRIVNNNVVTLTSENGKGVIYNMIDEYGNECPYDFKNIKFHHDGLGTDVYTFTWIDENYNVKDTSVFGNNGTLTYYGEIRGVYGNVIKPYIELIYDEDSEEYIGTKQSLNHIVFISDYEYEYSENDGFNGCCNNSFGNGCHNNSFGNFCNGNSFGNGCHTNSFGNSCNGNSFDYTCLRNSFGARCTRIIFGNDCSDNSFGNDCSGNSFNNSCCDNNFGNFCQFNSFGSYCQYNIFGNYCSYNTFRLSPSNTATLLNYCQSNHFDDGCSYNVIWNAVQLTTYNRLQNINVVRGVSATSGSNFINIVDTNAAYEIKVAKNSSGDIKIYCEADLIK